MTAPAAARPTTRPNRTGGPTMPADHVMTDGAEGRVQCACGEVSPRMGTERNRREWRTNHRRKAREAAVRVPCTATGQRRSFTSEEWIASSAACPDCGETVALWVRGTDLVGSARVRAHRAPAGVTPGPYAHREGVDRGGQAAE